MADSRTCRAVGLDVHGVLIEREVPDLEKEPAAVVRVAQQHAADCYHEALQKATGQDIPVHADVLWMHEQWALDNIPRSRGGETLSHRNFLVAVNRAALGRAFASLGLSEQQLTQIACEVRRLRKKNRAAYAHYPDMRTFLAWVHDTHGAPLHLVTGQEPEKVEEHITTCSVVREHIVAVHTAHDLGGNKLSRHFWKNLLHKLGLEPQDLVMIGNEIPIDAACTQEDIPAIIFDRGGIREQYFRTSGKRNGVKFIGLDDELPPRAPFIAFAKDTEELKAWLLRIPYRPVSGV